MADAPGTYTAIIDRPNGPIDLTDTGVLHIVGLAGRGPVDRAVEVRSLDELDAVYGPPQPYSGLHNWLRAHFAAGRARAIVARYVGPGATRASANISDGTGTTLVISAKAPGGYGNALAYDIDVSGSGFVLKVFEGARLVEASGVLEDKHAALDWAAAKAKHINLTSGAASGDPIATGTNQALAGGADDRGNATDQHRIAALDLFNQDPFGGQVGQVAIADATTTAVHDALGAHGGAFNRWPLRQLPDIADAAALISARALIADVASARRTGELYGSWAVIDGPVPGSTVKVPWAAVQGGLIAAGDRRDGPSQPAAGDWGIAPSIVRDLTHHWSDSDRALLNNAGINVARRVRGQIKTYGTRTLADPQTDPEWVGVGGAREIMRIRALGDEILEHYVHKRISRESELSQPEGQLRTMLRREWNGGDGALWGDTEEEAFDVQLSLDTSTPGRVALIADLEVKTSEAPERAQLNIAKVYLLEEV